MHFTLFKIDTKKQYLFSALIVCSVSAICFLLSPFISPEVVAFILLLTVSVIAMLFDIFPVLLAALLSAIIWDYFFLLPRFNFRLGNTEDKIMLSMYFVIAMVNAVLISKIRQVEKIARDKEEKAQTLKLYDTVLNSLSHEFRTPLAAIIGATDNLLAKPVKLTENDKEKLLSEISIASLRLNQQVENLLNMSRLESGFIEPKMDWCDMNELVADVLLRLEDNTQNHHILVEINDAMPLVKLDYGLMDQVIYNLLLNACQYTTSQSTIKINCQYINNNLLIIIEDNGNGFPPNEIDRAFEKFYRLEHSRTTGTGLGLSLVKGFVEAHKGVITLENGETSGAKFTIKIPSGYTVLKQMDND